MNEQEKLVFSVEKDRINNLELNIYEQSGIVPDWATIAGDYWEQGSEDIDVMKHIIMKYQGDVNHNKEVSRLRRMEGQSSLISAVSHNITATDKRKPGSRYMGGCTIFGNFHRKFNMRQSFQGLKGAPDQIRYIANLWNILTQEEK